MVASHGTAGWTCKAAVRAADVARRWIARRSLHREIVGAVQVGCGPLWQKGLICFFWVRTRFAKVKRAQPQVTMDLGRASFDVSLPFCPQVKVEAPEPIALPQSIPFEVCSRLTKFKKVCVLANLSKVKNICTKSYLRICRRQLLSSLRSAVCIPPREWFI